MANPDTGQLLPRRHCPGQYLLSPKEVSVYIPAELVCSSFIRSAHSRDHPRLGGIHVSIPVKIEYKRRAAR